MLHFHNTNNFQQTQTLQHFSLQWRTLHRFKITKSWKLKFHREKLAFATLSADNLTTKYIPCLVINDQGMLTVARPSTNKGADPLPTRGGVRPPPASTLMKKI